MQKIKFLLESVNWKYFFDEGYFKNFRTNFNKESYWLHQNKIAELRRKNNNHKRSGNTTIRALVVFVTTIFVALFNDSYVPLFVVNSDSIFIKITSVGVSGVVMSAPIIFVIWIFRDKNRLMELTNARKDTNLKEFQQLQRWATGNIDGDNEDNRVALQISALHSLRAYLKGEYGESFRRGAYEIFRAILATQHQKILQLINIQKSIGAPNLEQLTNGKFFSDMMDAIDSSQLTKQLNIIASEEWFNLLINHNFPTKGISLVGVDLSDAYLHHCTYGKTLDLQFAQLQGANLQNTQLQRANLSNAELQEARLNYAQLQRTNFSGAALQGASLSLTQLQRTNFRGAQLQRANLSNVQLQGVNLSNVQLQGANLNNVQLQGANLSNVQLQGADLSSAQLQGANLNNAQLQGVDLRGVQLQGVYASGAYDWSDFKSRIERRIDKKTESKNLKGQYNALDDEEKSKLISELKIVGGFKTIDAISRIQSAPKTLDLSKAITGKYSQEEANKWLNDYKNIKDDDF